MSTSLTVETLPERLQPGATLCTSCHHAVWYALQHSVHCRCTLLSRESYTSASPHTLVRECDGPSTRTELSKYIGQRDPDLEPNHPNSTTYEELPANLQSGPTACGNCPSAVWYATTHEAHCGCLLLHAESYTSEQPSARIERCDGVLISTLQLLRRKA